MDSFYCILEFLRKQRTERKCKKKIVVSDSSGSEAESTIE